MQFEFERGNQSWVQLGEPEKIVIESIEDNLKSVREGKPYCTYERWVEAYADWLIKQVKVHHE